jgi:hypothetical protein
MAKPMKFMDELTNADITGVSITITGEQAKLIIQLIEAVRTFQPMAKKPDLEPMLAALKAIGDA